MKITWSMPDLERRVRQKMPEMLNLIIATLQTQRAMIFDAEGAYNGRQAWKKSKRAEKTGGQTLSKSGELRRSIGPSNSGITPGRSKGTIIEIEGTRVTLGSSLVYAAIQNNGGIVKHPGTKNGFGKGIKIRQHNIKIDKRPFMDYTEEDRQEVLSTLVNYLTDVLNEH